MPRFAPALAAALLTFAAPTLAADAPTCGNADLIYSEAGVEWITSDGLFDAMVLMGDDYASAGRSLWLEAGDRNHGSDLRIKDTYNWLEDMRDADPSDTLTVLGKHFDEARNAYDAEAAEIRAESRRHPTMKRLARLLRAWIRAAEATNPKPGSTEAATLGHLENKLAALRQSLTESRKELRTLRAERRAAVQASNTLDAGLEWIDTMLCAFERG